MKLINKFFKRKSMDNRNMKIEKTLIGDDIVSCINILQEQLIKEVGTHKRFASEYLKKDGKTTYLFAKAKAAAERLNILLEAYEQQ